MKAAGQFKMLASAMFAVIGLVTAVVLSGCGGDNGTGSNHNNPDPDNPGGGGDPSYTYTGGTVKIGNQTWMKKNLDRATTNSKCYENSAANCVKYGRLYTWSDAKTACPTGWHLPSDAEWTVLTDYVGGSNTAGTKLKSSQYWNSYSGVPVGTDQYGFSALPGGFGISDGDFYNAGNGGYWWSATEDNADLAWYRYMYYTYESVGRNYDYKTILFSVRCLQD